jgi:putative hemolysin
MSGVFLEFIVIVFLVVLNGFFSMAEIALLSCRETRIRHLAEKGDPRARIVLELLHDRPRLLSTIQAGVSLVGIVTGALGGTALAGRLAGELTRAGIPGWLSSVSCFILVVFLVTYLSIIIGELIPKQIALSDGEGTALRLARIILVLSRVLAPAAGVLARSSTAVLRLFHVSQAASSHVSAEEIRVLIDEGIKGGRLRPGQGRLVRSAMIFTEKRVWELMTPRSDVVWLESREPADLVRRRLAETSHSRFPVCEGGLDAVVGVVRAKDILDGHAEDGLDGSMRPPLFVPQNALATRALESMRALRSDLALAVDEYGIVQGLVTIHDILHALVGEGLPGHDGDDGMAVRRPDGSWLMDGILETSRFRDLLSLHDLVLPQVCRTLGGIIMSHLGRIPNPKDMVQVGGIRLEVLTMEGNRVGKVRAVRTVRVDMG